MYQENSSRVASRDGNEPARTASETETIKEEPPAAPKAVAAPEPVLQEAPSAVGYQAFIDSYVVPFDKLGQEIDPDVAKLTGFVLEGFRAEKEFLELVSLSKPAPQEQIIPYLSPIQEQIKNVVETAEKYRGKFPNHVKTINEFVPALSWVVIECGGGNNRPIKLHLGTFNDSSRYWSDRIVKEYKDKDKIHVEWVNLLKKIFAGLSDYLDEFHSSGLAWNVKDGLPIAEAAKKLKDASSGPITASAPATGGLPPPPPPPPPPANFYDEEPKAGGIGAVFSELNKGTDITKGLKKVDRSQQTHKNPSLRRSDSSSSDKKAVPKPPKKPTALSKVKKLPPKLELNDSKWLVANYDGDHNIIIAGEMGHSVFIGKCTNSTIKINGKINAITISECSSVGIVIDSLISGVDVIKTTKFQLQTLGFVPLISLDQSHEGEIYLSVKSLESQIFTSQTTALNVYLPDENSEDGDFKENPLPEQIVHSYDKKTGKLVSEVVLEGSG